MRDQGWKASMRDQGWKAGMRDQGWKASMTVEAALVMFLVLMILMGCMRMAMTLHQRVVERAGVYWVELEDVDRKFRLYSLGREIIE